MKNITQSSVSTTALLWSAIVVSTAFHALKSLHQYSVVSSSIKRNAVSPYLLPATGNMIGFAAQMLDTAFTVFASSVGVGSLA